MYMMWPIIKGEKDFIGIQFSIRFEKIIELHEEHTNTKNNEKNKAYKSQRISRP